MFMDRKTQDCQNIIFQHFIYGFNANPIKTLANYFMDIHKLILKFIWAGKKPRTDNTILKKNKVGG